jgi:hypothetical protein
MSRLQQQQISVPVVSARLVQFPVALAVALLLALAAIPAQAQTFNVIHSFTGPDGANSLAGLTMTERGISTEQPGLAGRPTATSNLDAARFSR